ncbi:heme oxygenase (biliverdin-producing) [Cylindrospermopsis raciborskii LB2897]|jgi:heme oxygenase|uniref:biliverdin-producing heme oxygenase n=1 Tax=Cylindrospermopsis raciborskii TaxID=77022 RepID=UPI001454DEC1|nr:heme oxygenase (biliverdin-producing) [Cylindrospermopsis raciborskii]MBG0743572.1 heme oxygenase (biliverdin-producing) [Cylindrospermopsis raciborskii KL1]NLQ07222.1 heme oxygenase (biliverdin-producing) [Cylindrospermopsis raciborskii LB2897]
MSSNLASQLRVGTKKAHTMAENVGFVKCFLKGVVEKNSYRKLVANFYFIYSAMEEEMEKHKTHPVVGKIYFPELNRKRSLEEDLAYYYGYNWREQIQLSPAGESYVKRIREISATAPELLVAHSYTRYLGDLSGGQILKNIAVTAMNLSAGEGTSFYEFADISDEKSFKTKYRQNLDAMPIDNETGDRIVEEANAAFSVNMKMFQELEGNLIKAIGVMVYNALTRKRSKGSTELVIAK